jgi:hypothetical protein
MVPCKIKNLLCSSRLRRVHNIKWRRFYTPTKKTKKLQIQKCFQNLISDEGPCSIMCVQNKTTLQAGTPSPYQQISQPASPVAADRRPHHQAADGFLPMAASRRCDPRSRPAAGRSSCCRPRCRYFHSWLRPDVGATPGRGSPVIPLVFARSLTLQLCPSKLSS